MFQYYLWSICDATNSQGHPIRVGIQHVDRGGLNLMYPGIKAKTLFITNFLKHTITNNPFIMQFLSTNNNPSFLHSMPTISYVKFFLLEISYILNEQITIPKKSTNLYQYYLGNLPEKPPNVPITRAHWRTIWRNTASNWTTHTIWFKIFLVCSCKR
jgi:hypothetical protein